MTTTAATATLLLLLWPLYRATCVSH